MNFPKSLSLEIGLDFISDLLLKPSY